MTQAAAAKTRGMSTVRLNELVRGKRGVTADTALRLAQLFKTTPQFWMHMQANFDLKAAMGRRGALKPATRPEADADDRRGSEGGQRAMAGNAPRHRRHSRQPRHCAFCKLQIL